MERLKVVLNWLPIAAIALREEMLNWALVFEGGRAVLVDGINQG